MRFQTGDLKAAVVLCESGLQVKQKLSLHPVEKEEGGGGVGSQTNLRLCLTQPSNYHISCASTVWEEVDRETEVGGVPVPVEVCAIPPRFPIFVSVHPFLCRVLGSSESVAFKDLAVKRNGCCGNVTLVSLVLFPLHNRFLCCWAGFRAQGGGLGCGV